MRRVLWLDAANRARAVFFRGGAHEIGRRFGGRHGGRFLGDFFVDRAVLRDAKDRLFLRSEQVEGFVHGRFLYDRAFRHGRGGLFFN